MNIEIKAQAAAEFVLHMKAKSGLSQSEISRRSAGSLPQRTISRIEADPLSATVDNLTVYLQIIGTTISEMDTYIKAKEVVGMEELRTSSSLKIQEAISCGISSLSQAYQVLEADPVARDVLHERGAFTWIEDSISSIKANGAKPIIGFYGLFDSAKSTVINTLLGQDWMPEGYQPETSIVNIIAHINDRPEWINSEVAVFKEGFKPGMLYDGELGESFLIEQGSKDILHRLGRHQYLEGSEDHREAAISMVFVNSNALEGVWFMDTPGDLNGIDKGADLRKAEGSLSLCDGIVFMCPVSGFLAGPALTYFHSILRSVPPTKQAGGNPLDHVRIVMSHAHHGVTDQQIGDIKLKLSNTFDRHSETIFKYWEETEGVRRATAQEFVDCIVAFYREIDARQQATVSAVLSLSEHCKRVQEDRVQIRVENSKGAASAKLRALQNAIESDMRSCEERIGEAESNYARFCRDDLPSLKVGGEKLLQLAKEISDEAREDIRSWYLSCMSVEALEGYITTNFDNKKEAQSDAPSMVMARLDQYVSKRMKQDTKLYTRELDNFLQQWEVKVNSGAFSGNASLKGEALSGGFDARAAMLAGIAGIGSYGAMVAYVATLGNLGGYIVAAKLAGILVSAGLASSVTAVTSVIATIGGPVTIMLAIALAMATFVYSLMGASWQKSLAKGISEQLEKQDVLDKLISSTATYWNDTNKAFKVGLEALEKETVGHYEQALSDARIEHDSAHLEQTMVAIARANEALA